MVHSNSQKLLEAPHIGSPKNSHTPQPNLVLRAKNSVGSANVTSFNQTPSTLPGLKKQQNSEALSLSSSKGPSRFLDSF